MPEPLRLPKVNMNMNDVQQIKHKKKRDIRTLIKDTELDGDFCGNLNDMDIDKHNQIDAPFEPKSKKMKQIGRIVLTQLKSPQISSQLLSQINNGLHFEPDLLIVTYFIIK